jgi:DTW domain-containing protein
VRVRRTTTRDLRCPACRLHRLLCLCAELPLVPTRTRIVLVLHQREEPKSTNTGRLALRCLPNSVVVAHGRLPADAGLGRDLVTSAPYPWQDSSGPCVLLSPDARARPIEEWRDAPSLTLIVPDGTWRHAARTRRRLPGLAELPSAIVPAGPPRYALRHDPRPGRLGTLEAVARALGALEGARVQAPLDQILQIVRDRTLRMRGYRAVKGTDEMTERGSGR